MTEAVEWVDAELVDDVEHLPTPTVPSGPVYRITRHTVLVEGELPPRVDEQVHFTERDFTVSRAAKERSGRRGARNTRVNRDSSRERFKAWCGADGRIAEPSTTTANLVAYFDHLMASGKPDGTQYSPDSLLAYVARIVSGYPKGERPDGSLVRDMIEDYRIEEYTGEKEQSAGLTLKYLVRVLDKIDESTRIGRRDAAMLALQYGMLYRSVEVTHLMVRHVRIDNDGVWVWTAKSKTRRKGNGRWRFVRDRADLRIVARVRAWLGDLRELREPDPDNPRAQNPAHGEPAYQPNKPLFRALTTTGNLKRRSNATVNGLFLTGRAVNEMVQARAAAAGVALINGLKVTSHSLRAGPNTDLATADVPLEERNEAGDWSPDSTLSDDTYNRPDGSQGVRKHDPLDAVPLYGDFPVRTLAAPAPGFLPDPDRDAT